MCKKVEAKVVKRARYKPTYLVIVREYVSFLGIRFWEGPWKDLRLRFRSEVEACALQQNIKAYLKGEYKI